MKKRIKITSTTARRVGRLVQVPTLRIAGNWLGLKVGQTVEVEHNTQGILIKPTT